MALKKCRECGNQISTTAKSCPQCGAAQRGLIAKLARGFIIIFVIIPIGIGIFMTVYQSETTDTSKARKSGSPNTPAKNWLLTTTTNPVDDSTTTILIIDPEQGSNRRGSYTLTARCKSNKTELYVNWHDYVGDDSNDVYSDWKNVLVRVGDKEATTQRWDISTDKRATFANHAIPLLREIAKADKLLIQTTPYNESPARAIYDTKGLNAPIGKIAKACNWNL